MLSDKMLCTAWCIFRQERSEGLFCGSLVGLAQEIFPGVFRLYDPDGKTLSTITSGAWEAFRDSGVFVIEPPVGWEADDEINSRSELIGIPAV